MLINPVRIIMDDKPKVVLLGKLPPPYMGPAIATDIILKSSLSIDVELIHVNTSINTEISGIGKWSVKKIMAIIGLYRTFLRELKTSMPDVVIVPISQTAIGFLKDAVFIKMAQKRGCKVIVHLRGSNLKNWINETSSLVKKAVVDVLKNVDGGIVLGQNLVDIFRDILPVDKVYVVANGRNFTDISAKQYTDVIKVLYLANFIESKGFYNVLEAINLLGKEQENFEFLAAGAWMDRGFRKKCERFVTEFNVPIEIRGAVSGRKKIDLLESASIFVFTPNGPEGHPWVLVEAAAHSLPIIATNQGAIVENVIHNCNGFIVNSNDPMEIKNRIMELKDVCLREKMGNASHEIYSKKFTEEKMVEGLKNAIFSTLKQVD